MQVSVTFRHMETDKGAKDYIKEKVNRLQKYIVNPREVHVVLSLERFQHIAEITIVGDGVTLNSQGKDNDLYTAIDKMVEKAERQIRERKGKGRNKKSNPSPLRSALHGESEVIGGEDRIPQITKRRRFLAKPMSLDEAVAQLSISEDDFLVFINSDSTQMNVLRKHQDGSYEWFEPSSE